MSYCEKIDSALTRLQDSKHAHKRKDSLRSALKARLSEIEESKKNGVTYKEIAEEIGVDYQNFVSTINRIKKNMRVKNTSTNKLNDEMIV